MNEDKKSKERIIIYKNYFSSAQWFSDKFPFLRTTHISLMRSLLFRIYFYRPGKVET